jgi:hypothetical protein
VHGNVPERDKQAREHDTELLADVLAVHSHQVDLGCLKGIPRAHRSSTYAGKRELGASRTSTNERVS